MRHSKRAIRKRRQHGKLIVSMIIVLLSLIAISAFLFSMSKKSGKF